MRLNIFRRSGPNADSTKAPGPALHGPVPYEVRDGTADDGDTLLGEPSAWEARRVTSHRRDGEFVEWLYDTQRQRGRLTDCFRCGAKTDGLRRFGASSSDGMAEAPSISAFGVCQECWDESSPERRMMWLTLHVAMWFATSAKEPPSGIRDGQPGHPQYHFRDIFTAMESWRRLAYGEPAYGAASWGPDAGFRPQFAPDSLGYSHFPDSEHDWHDATNGLEICAGCTQMRVRPEPGQPYAVDGNGDPIREVWPEIARRRIEEQLQARREWEQERQRLVDDGWEPLDPESGETCTETLFRGDFMDNRACGEPAVGVRSGFGPRCEEHKPAKFRDAPLTP